MIDPIRLLLLTDTTCPGRGCIGLHMFALLVTYAFGSACLPVAHHLDERTFSVFLVGGFVGFLERVYAVSLCLRLHTVSL